MIFLKIKSVSCRLQTRLNRLVSGKLWCTVSGSGSSWTLESARPGGNGSRFQGMENGVGCILYRPKTKMKSENYPGIKRKLIFNTIIFRFHVSFWGWFSCWTSNMWRISDGIRFPSYMGRSPDRSGPDCLLPELNTIPVVKVGPSTLLTQPFGPQWAGLIWSLDRLDMQLVLRSGVAMDTAAEFSRCFLKWFMDHVACLQKSWWVSILSWLSWLDVHISIIYHINVQIWTLRSLNLYMFPVQLWDFLGQKTSQVWISCLSGRCSGLNNGATGKVTGVAEWICIYIYTHAHACDR